MRQSDEHSADDIPNLERNVKNASRMAQRVVTFIKKQKTVQSVLKNLHLVRPASVPVRKKQFWCISHFSYSNTFWTWTKNDFTDCLINSGVFNLSYFTTLSVLAYLRFYFPTLSENCMTIISTQETNSECKKSETVFFFEPQDRIVERCLINIQGGTVVHAPKKFVLGELWVYLIRKRFNYHSTAVQYYGPDSVVGDFGSFGREDWKIPDGRVLEGLCAGLAASRAQQ